MRKFLVIMDNSKECLNAMRFAAGRAASTGGGVTILAVIEPEEFQHWIGVADVMRAEARERIEAHFEVFKGVMEKNNGITPELIIREGRKEDEVMDTVKEHPEIGVLVLGAGVSGEGPGPLVTSLSRKSGSLPVPITIVPGAMTKEDIQAVV